MKCCTTDKTPNLDYKCQLQKPISRGDGNTNPTDWENVATVWAQIQDRTGTEGTRNQETVAQARVFVTIRNRADVVPTWRFVHTEHTGRQRVLNVEALVRTGDRQDYLTLICGEVY